MEDPEGMRWVAAITLAGSGTDPRYIPFVVNNTELRERELHRIGRHFCHFIVTRQFY